MSLQHITSNAAQPAKIVGRTSIKGCHMRGNMQSNYGPLRWDECIFIGWNTQAHLRVWCATLWPVMLSILNYSVVGKCLSFNLLSSVWRPVAPNEGTCRVMVHDISRAVITFFWLKIVINASNPIYRMLSSNKSFRPTHPPDLLVDSWPKSLAAVVSTLKCSQQPARKYLRGRSFCSLDSGPYLEFCGCRIQPTKGSPIIRYESRRNNVTTTVHGSCH